MNDHEDPRWAAGRAAIEAMPDRPAFGTSIPLHDTRAEERAAFLAGFVCAEGDKTMAEANAYADDFLAALDHHRASRAGGVVSAPADPLALVDRLEKRAREHSSPLATLLEEAAQALRAQLAAPEPVAGWPDDVVERVARGIWQRIDSGAWFQASVLGKGFWLSQARDLLGPYPVSPPVAQAARDVRAGIYVASRASLPERGAMWRSLRSSGVPIISTWIDEDGEGATGDFGDLWGRITAEVTRAERLVFYAEPGDLPMKGALIEVGAALAAGVAVFAVLPGVVLEPRSMRPVGSWLAHPLVTIVDTVDDAIRALLPAVAPEPAALDESPRTAPDACTACHNSDDCGSVDVCRAVAGVYGQSMPPEPSAVRREGVRQDNQAVTDSVGCVFTDLGIPVPVWLDQMPELPRDAAWQPGAEGLLGPTPPSHGGDAAEEVVRHVCDYPTCSVRGSGHPLACGCRSASGDQT